MGSTLASEPLLRELSLSPTVTAKRPPSPDRPEVGGRHPLPFLRLLLPRTRGLDPPGRTSRALPQGGPGGRSPHPPGPASPLPASGPPVLRPCRRRRAPGGPGRPGARAVPPCCRRGRGGGWPLRRPRPARAAPSGRRERSRPGRRACRALTGHAQGAPFVGAVRGPADVVWLVAVATCRCRILILFFSLISVQFVAFHFPRHHSELTSSDLSDRQTLLT